MKKIDDVLTSLLRSPRLTARTIAEFKWVIFCAALTTVLSGCGGGLGAATTMIAGTVSGLEPGTTVVLANNGTQTVSVAANGSFFFSGQVQAGTTYNVTVSSNPAGGTCKITNGSGTVGEYAEDVSNIDVTCTATLGSIYGVVSGLNAGAELVLQNQIYSFNSQAPDTLTIKANGAFAFPTLVEEGYPYNVTVATQPAGQTCAVANGAGSVPTKGSITAVQVTCH